MANNTNERLLPISEVAKRVGFKRASIYKKMKDGKFPKPCKVDHASRWLESEIEAWIKAVKEQRAA